MGVVNAADWTEADYGREDGRADALAGHEPQVSAGGPIDDYVTAYLDAYDAALAETAPDYVRPVAR